MLLTANLTSIEDFPNSVDTAKKLQMSDTDIFNEILGCLITMEIEFCK